MKNALIIFALLFPLNSWSHWSERSQKRENQRWTLQEWLAQKERNQMMDIWLKLNSPSPYELSLSASYYSYLLNKNQSFTSVRGSISAYAQIFGLSLEHENNVQESISDLTGIFNLRLIGNSLQNSNVTIHYGLRTRNLTSLTQEIRLPQQFAELSLKLHLNRYFGILGNYRYFLPTSDTHLGDIEAHSWLAGVFIDFSSIRIFAQSQNEIFNSSNRSGIESGIQIIF